MKKATAVLAMVMFLLIGCSGIQIVSSGNNDALVKIAAMKLGGEFAKKYPGEVEKITVFAEAIEGNISQSLFDVAKAYLAGKVADDPVDKECLEELLSMIVIQDGAEIDLDKFETAIDAFMVGVKAAVGSDG